MLARLHDNIANHIMALLQIKPNFLNLIFNLDHFLICLITQLRKKNTLPEQQQEINARVGTSSQACLHYLCGSCMLLKPMKMFW